MKAVAYRCRKWCVSAAAYILSLQRQYGWGICGAAHNCFLSWLGLWSQRHKATSKSRDPSLFYSVRIGTLYERRLQWPTVMLWTGGKDIAAANSVGRWFRSWSLADDGGHCLALCFVTYLGGRTGEWPRRTRLPRNQPREGTGPRHTIGSFHVVALLWTFGSKIFGTVV